MASEVEQRRQPDALVERRLNDVCRRLRRVDTLATLALLAAVTLAYALAMALFDLWTRGWPLAPVARWLGFAAFVVVTGAVVVRLTLLNLRRINPYYAARHLEDTVPAAHNSLINWLDLHGQEDIPAAFRKNLGLYAARQIKEADPEEVLHHSGSWWLLGCCIALLLGLLMLLARDPQQFLSLMQRAFLPFRGTPVASRTHITLIRPERGNVSVSPNQVVPFAVHVSGRVPDVNEPGAPTLLYRYQPQDEPIALPLQPDNLGNWGLRMSGDQVRTGFLYKIAAGDAETPWYEVTVRAPAQAQQFEVAYTYRPYLHLEKKKVLFPNQDEVLPRIAGHAGTEVELLVRTNRSVATASVMLAAGATQKELSAQVDAYDRATFRCKWVLERSGQIRVAFTSSEGETNIDRTTPYDVHVLEDTSPRVVLTAPGQDVSLPANGTLPLAGKAEDDVGIKALTLKLQVSGTKTLFAPKPYLDGKPLRLADGSLPDVLEYADFIAVDQLRGADGAPFRAVPGLVLEYWLEAHDGSDFPNPQGQLGKSLAYKITIADPDGDAQKQQQERQRAEQQREQRQKQQQEKLAQQKQQKNDQGQQQPQPAQGEEEQKTQQELSRLEKEKQQTENQLQKALQEQEKQDQQQKQQQREEQRGQGKGEDNQPRSDDKQGKQGDGAAPAQAKDKEQHGKQSELPGAPKGDGKQQSGQQQGDANKQQQEKDQAGRKDSPGNSKDDGKQEAAAAKQQKSDGGPAQAKADGGKGQDKQKSDGGPAQAKADGGKGQDKQKSDGGAAQAKADGGKGQDRQKSDGAADQAKSDAGKGQDKQKSDGAADQAKSDAGKGQDKGNSKSSQSPDGAGQAKEKGGEKQPAAAKGDDPKNTAGAEQKQQQKGPGAASGAPQAQAKRDPADKGDAGSEPAQGAKEKQEPGLGQAKGADTTAAKSDGKKGDTAPGTKVAPQAQAKSGPGDTAGTKEAKGQAKEPPRGEAQGAAIAKGDPPPGSEMKEPTWDDIARLLDQMRQKEGLPDAAKELAQIGKHAGDPKMRDAAREALAQAGRDPATGQPKDGGSQKPATTKGPGADKGSEPAAAADKGAKPGDPMTASKGSGGNAPAPAQSGKAPEDATAGHSAPGGKGSDNEIKPGEANRDFAGRGGNLQLEDLKKRVTPELLRQAGLTEADWQRYLQQAEAYDQTLRKLKSPRSASGAKDLRGQGGNLPGAGPSAVRGPGDSAAPLDAGQAQPPPELREAQRRFSTKK